MTWSEESELNAASSLTAQAAISNMLFQMWQILEWEKRKFSLLQLV